MKRKKRIPFAKYVLHALITLFPKGENVSLWESFPSFRQSRMKQQEDHWAEVGPVLSLFQIEERKVVKKWNLLLFLVLAVKRRKKKSSFPNPSLFSIFRNWLPISEKQSGAIDLKRKKGRTKAGETKKESSAEAVQIVVQSVRSPTKLEAVILWRVGRFPNQKYLWFEKVFYSFFGSLSANECHEIRIFTHSKSGTIRGHFIFIILDADFNGQQRSIPYPQYRWQFFLQKVFVAWRVEAHTTQMFYRFRRYQRPFPMINLSFSSARQERLRICFLSLFSPPNPRHTFGTV